MPKIFTDAVAAIAMAEALKGIVYKFGSIYKVYWGGMPLPIKLEPYWIGSLSNDTLANYLDTI